MSLSRTPFALVAGFLAASLSACSAAEPEPTPMESFVPGSIPGPWAAEMEDLIVNFESEFAARVFADGEVSEQEFAEAKQIVLDCFAAEGLTAEWDQYGNIGVGGAPDSDEPPDAMGGCSFEDGGVMVTYYQMMLNPQNEDQMELSARCLVEQGFMEPGFTGDDLDQAYDSGSFAWLPADPAAQRCLVDPLGVVE